MASTITLAILVIFVFVALYLLYTVYSYFTYTYLISTPTSIQTVDNKRYKVSYNQVPSGSSTRYTISMWLFVTSLSTVDRNVIILNRDNKFVLYLNGRTLKITANTNSTKVNVKDDGSVEVSDNTNVMTITDNFLFQKWAHIVVSVDGNVIDVYLDGKLAKSKQMVLPAPAMTDDVYLGNAYMYAEVTRLSMDGAPSSPQDVYRLYGNSSGVTKTKGANYNINMDLAKNGVVQKTVTIY